jgi:hypothetical protein
VGLEGAELADAEPVEVVLEDAEFEDAGGAAAGLVWAGPNRGESRIIPRASAPVQLESDVMAAPPMCGEGILAC